jgi:hypothetical protein
MEDCDGRGASRSIETGDPATADSGKISGGNLVAKALKAEGTEVIFTLCGGHIIDMWLGDVHFEQFAKMLGGYGEEYATPGRLLPP